MAFVDKTFLIGALATLALAGVVGLIVYGIGVDPDLGALIIILGAIGTGLIGGQVEKRMPPRRHH
jgi:outer membrane lipoprotein SlyB